MIRSASGTGLGENANSRGTHDGEDGLDSRGRRRVESFHTADEARAWLEKNNPEGVAFEMS